MELKPLNPANAPERSSYPDGFIPMNKQVQNLEVPYIPGYIQYWFYGKPDRIARALRGGYTFVKDDEIYPTEKGLGNDSASSGNNNLGTNVSKLAGTEVGRDGQAIEMVLMKIPVELYEKSQKILEDRNESIAAAIRGDGLGADRDKAVDRQHRYVDADRTNITLFTKKR